MSVISIQTREELGQVKADKSVLFFWAQWHEPSKQGGQLHDIFKAIAEKYPSIQFAAIEAEAVPELSEAYQITVVPTFILRMGSTVFDKLEGANPSDLSNLVKKLNGATASEPNYDSQKELFQRLERLVNAAPVMLFMKGSPAQPRCGFSRKIVEILQNDQIPFASFDILTDEEVRQGLKEYSDWPTYPQLYANGTLIGGLDIVKELAEAGNLRSQLNIDKILENYKTEKPGAMEIPSADPKQVLAERLKSLINTAPVMLFMKGSPAQPKCGFSSQMVEILKKENISFASFDILTDEEVRQGLKEYSDWPTYPQLYANGTLIGGLDIVKELAESGSLKSSLN